MVLLISIFSSIAFTVGAYIFVGQQRELFYTFALGALSVPILTRLRVGAAELKGLKKVVRAMIPEKIIVPLLFITGIFVLSRFKTGVGSDWAMALRLMVSLGALGLLVWLLRQHVLHLISAVGGSNTLTARKWKWITTAQDMLLIGGFNLILFRADVIMVGAIISPTESGLYNVASRIASILVFVLSSINSILAPIASDLYSQQKKGELQDVVAIAAKVAFVFSASAALLIFLLQSNILSLFGSEFRSSSQALWPLLIGQLANSFAGPAILLLNMTDRQRTSAKILGASAAANIALNIVLINQFGFQGAAFATMTTMVGWNVASVYYVRQELGLNSTASLNLW
jgi:O-antigen/teichoic acid export membrane protein